MKLRLILAVLVAFCWVAGCAAQDEGPVERVPVQKSAPPPQNNADKPPRSDKPAPDESSSKETQIDISPPAGDAKDHPGAALDGESDAGEFHPWDPHKAMKAIEVGDFYAKRENYQAAISRYREALEYKPHDAEATYKLAEALEKSGDLKEAMQNYQEYLKVLPHGPYADKAQKGIARLKEKGIAATAQPDAKPK